jgi:hypothetical protein
MGVEDIPEDGSDATEGKICVFAVKNTEITLETHAITFGPVYCLAMLDASTLISGNGNRVTAWHYLQDELDVQLMELSFNLVPSAALCMDF